MYSTLAVVASVVGMAVCVTANVDDPKPQLVPVIEDVTYAVQKINPPVLIVKVTGQVRTLGYSKPTLTRTQSVTPPQDGVQDYQFTAIPPTGIAGQALAEVHAEDAWPDFEKSAPWLKGVRIRGTGTGVKLIWIKADVIVPLAEMTGKAKVGQVVEIQVNQATAKPVPTDVVISVGGQVVPASQFSHATSGDVTNATHSFRFLVTTKGNQKITISCALGKSKIERTVELSVME